MFELNCQRHKQDNNILDVLRNFVSKLSDDRSRLNMRRGDYPILSQQKELNEHTIENYNCSIVWTDKETMSIDGVKFESKDDLAMFMLRWS